MFQTPGRPVRAVSLGAQAALKSDIGNMRKDIEKLRERIARLEGKFELLFQGLRMRIEPKNIDGAD